MEIAQLILNFIWKHKGPRRTKNESEHNKTKRQKLHRRNKVVRLVLSEVKTYKATLSKTVVSV